jgi:hypothetical protein
MEHITPSHAGRRARGTHAVAWQHAAGAQSSSRAHSAPSASAAEASIGPAAPAPGATGATGATRGSLPTRPPLEGGSAAGATDDAPPLQQTMAPAHTSKSSAERADGFIPIEVAHRAQRG